MARDWNRGLRKMHDAHDRSADEENRALWPEFVRRFRSGEFDVYANGERYVSWDALDRFIRR